MPLPVAANSGPGLVEDSGCRAGVADAAAPGTTGAAKVIFDKRGVNSRGELVARLFSEHVLRDFEGAVGHL